MASDKRSGPLLRVEGSCLDCDHLRLDADVYRCAHPKASSVAEPMICSAHREPRPPPLCPELPAARLALARGIVAESPCGTALVRQTGGNLPCVVKGEHVEHRSACGRRWGGEDFADHPDFDSRAFCDDGSSR